MALAELVGNTTRAAPTSTSGKLVGMEAWSLWPASLDASQSSKSAHRS